LRRFLKAFMARLSSSSVIMIRSYPTFQSALTIYLERGFFPRNSNIPQGKIAVLR
jgi:hypothetical protein